jgi:hypothetical protein
MSQTEILKNQPVTKCHGFKLNASRYFSHVDKIVVKYFLV